MRKISEVLRQYHALNYSHRDIARSLNLGKTTVTRYLALADAASISWPLPEGLTEEALYQHLFLPVESPSKQRVLPDWEWVCQELRKKGMTRQLLWREYRDTHPDGYGYSQFCSRYSAYLKATTPVMRQVHKGGEKTFVDYAGMVVPWIDPVTGEIHEAQIFVGCLGASQYTFVEASPSQQLPDWIKSHSHMWEFFGGVSEMVVPDYVPRNIIRVMCPPPLCGR
jgi:transposase